MTLISTLGGTHEYQTHRSIIDSAERATFGQAVREKSLAESWLQTSTLDFTIQRPGGLLHGSATGNAQLSKNEEVHGLVMREDVALNALMLAEKESLNSHIYSLCRPWTDTPLITHIVST